MTLARGVAFVTTAAMVAACGGNVSQQPTGDGGSQSGSDGGPYEDVTVIPNADGSGPSSPDGSIGSDGSGPANPEGGVDATTSGMGGTPVDAGYYYGDGSFWVEGGAYPPGDSGEQGEPDAEGDDAAPGCTALAACCATLSGSSQALCNSVVSGGDATNCATELSQLQAGGDCTGVTVLATHVQITPHLMVSDGTTLFWTTFEASPGLLAVPVQGGTVTTLLSAQTANSGGGQFLAVDDVNVYVLEGNSIIRIPKDGAPATLINEPSAAVQGATSLGGTAYWIEAPAGGNGGPNQSFTVKSSPLQGTAITTIGTYASHLPDNSFIAVTSSTAFVGGFGLGLLDFPLTGVPAGGPGMANVDQCLWVSSDTSAVYCAEATGSNQSVASDGTVANLGPANSTFDIVADDTYVYWADYTTAGSIMKAPKDGSGSATVLTYDTSPRAIAVDAHSVYWGDDEGYIKSMPK